MGCEDDRKADQLIMISPGIQDNAKMLEDELNITINSHDQDVIIYSSELKNRINNHAIF
jgi:hypothetical protein